MNYLLRLTPSDIQIRGMAHPHSLRHPLFRRRWFTEEVIITCVRWYLRFKLSYRDLTELARELGVSVAPSTVLRWVVRYVPEFEKCWLHCQTSIQHLWC
jgi:transposase-like protein